MTATSNTHAAYQKEPEEEIALGNDYGLKYFLKNMKKPPPDMWKTWVLIIILAFFCGMVVSANYYQNKCNLFIQDKCFESQIGYEDNMTNLANASFDIDKETNYSLKNFFLNEDDIT